MRRIWFQLHKWTGLIIGLQVLAWIGSGLFMTFVPIETVRGEHNIRTIEAPDLRETKVGGYPEKALKALAGRVTRVELVHLDGRPAWRADMEGKPGAIIDDASGEVLSPLGETIARRIAEADFAGNGKIVAATLLEGNPPIEYRGDLPVWQFSFDDPGNTNLYVSPLSGKVVARRSSTWRVYDFLWSLHIMDYRDRTDFNNWLVVMSALVALVLTISGMVILVYRFLVPRL